ncbi:hypothetical protein [Streptosporangium vulgare]|uniref:hypothetical protein n=1 Tax=Streptosporangium vulgare TaxID=46190 RepID=UPI0036DF874C
MERPTPTVSPVGAVLAAAADRVDSLPHARMGRVDVHLALRDASPSYELTQAALDRLAAHLHETGVDDRWLHQWTPRCGRSDVAAYLRAAAEVIA